MSYAGAGGPVGTKMDVVDDTQRFALGTTARDDTGGLRMYVTSDAAITARSVVHISETYKANMITDALAIVSGRIGAEVASVTISVSGHFFWAATSWFMKKIRVLGSCVKNVSLYTSNTAGALDDSTVSASHFLIMGCTITTTNPSATATVINSITQGDAMVRLIVA